MRCQGGRFEANDGSTQGAARPPSAVARESSQREHTRSAVGAKRGLGHVAGRVQHDPVWAKPKLGLVPTLLALPKRWQRRGIRVCCFPVVPQRVSRLVHARTRVARKWAGRCHDCPGTRDRNRGGCGTRRLAAVLANTGSRPRHRHAGSRGVGIGTQPVRRRLLRVWGGRRGERGGHGRREGELKPKVFCDNALPPTNFTQPVSAIHADTVRVSGRYGFPGPLNYCISKTPPTTVSRTHQPNPTSPLPPSPLGGWGVAPPPPYTRSRSPCSGGCRTRGPPCTGVRVSKRPVVSWNRTAPVGRGPLGTRRPSPAPLRGKRDGHACELV